MATLNIMTFNLGMGDKNPNWQDRTGARQAEYIKSQKADIVFLQEVDINTKRSGQVNQAEAIARLSGLSHSVFGKHQDFQGGQYGLAVVSRFPLFDVRTYPIPYPDWWWLPTKWPKPQDMVVMTMQVNLDSLVAGRTIQLIANHWPSDPDVGQYRQDQRLEAAKLIASLSVGSDMILAGDLNAPFSSQEVQLIVNTLNLRRVRTSAPAPPKDDGDGESGEIDHILFRGAFTVQSFNAPRDGTLSDHPIPQASMDFTTPPIPKLKVLSVKVNPYPVRLNKPVTTTIYASDKDTGQAVAGTVTLVDPDGKTATFNANTAFTYTFRKKRVRRSFSYRLERLFRDVMIHLRRRDDNGNDGYGEVISTTCSVTASGYRETWVDLGLD